MPVKIPNSLPASGILAKENIFVMDENRASMQDIRPLHIAILNLMPDKETTETQLLRLLGNTSLQIEISLLYTASHMPKNTSKKHLASFYHTFDEVKDTKFDGLIITGAPVEHVEFEEVDYWEELCRIMDWANSNVYSTFYICWAAQAGLYHHYGIKKYPLNAKKFGVFHHKVLNNTNKLMRGFDDMFWAPHSRHAEIRRRDVLKHSDQLEILSYGEESGVHIVASRDLRQIFVTGHSEYDFDTLDKEYKRDLAKGLPIDIPKHYYPGNDPKNTPQVSWRSHANLLFGNWLNYCVYQETPYNISEIH